MLTLEPWPFSLLLPFRHIRCAYASFLGVNDSTPSMLEADVSVAWCHLWRAAVMLPAANDQEVAYHRQLRDQFEMTDADYSTELEKLDRELGASVVEFRR